LTNIYILSLLACIICYSIISLGFIPLSNAQKTIDNSEKKIDYTHHKTTVNGIQLHYVLGGGDYGQGDPIVLLHGWPQTWYEWRHIIPQLIANNYTVIAPDLRGLGDSEKPQTGYDTKTVADDIYQLLKKVGYSKIYLVAHDWGGAVAYSYAAEHPEGVKKMVILDNFLPGFGYEEAANFSPNVIWHFSFHNVRDLPEALIAAQEKLYLSYIINQYTYNSSAISQEDIDEYVNILVLQEV